MKPLRIAIIGGSLGGLFTGILLQRDGHDVKIFERSAGGLAGRGAGLVGQHDLFRILRLIGCEHVARIGVVAHERIYLDRQGNIAETVHTPQMQISWDYLYHTVASHIKGEGYVLGRRAVEVRDADRGAEVVFADGRSEFADLVIGADGLGSVVRRSLNAEDYQNEFAGYVAWRGLMPEQLLPKEASLLLECFAFFVTRGSHALGYLVPGPNGETAKGSRRYNWVWYRRVEGSELASVFTDKDGQTHPFSLPRSGLPTKRRERLWADATEMLPPQFAQAVAAEQSPSIQGIFDYEAPNMVGKSVALIGDAAYVVRPHTAMGVSKAAGDAMALREALADEANLPSALRRFEQARSIIGREIAAYGRRLGATAI